MAPVADIAVLYADSGMLPPRTFGKARGGTLHPLVLRLRRSIDMEVVSVAPLA